MNQQNGDAQAIIDAVQRLNEPRDWTFTDPDSGKAVRVAVLPGKDGLSLESIKPFLDEYLDAPRRLKGTARTETLDSFCALVLQHKTLNTAVFARLGESTGLEAVIDYYGKNELGKGSAPSFCGHRITYAFPMTPEFVLWQNATQWRGQNAFAQFLDARRFELIDPLDVETIAEGSLVYDVLFRAVARDKRGDLDGQKGTVFASPGDIMQLVETLSGHSKTRFAEVKTDRFGGMKATIEKEGRVDGDEKIPHLFLVQIAAFAGGDKLVLPARIRARVGDRGLELAAEIVGAERVLEKAFGEAIKEVAAKTSCPVFRGSPEA